MNKKTKVIISSLVISLGLSGCSFVLNKDNKITVKYDKELAFDNDNKVDEIINSKDKQEINLDYTYLIDESEYTNKTLAHVIESETFDSNKKLFEFNNDKDIEIINNTITNPIELPKAFILYNIDDMNKLIKYYGDCKIDYKKLYTLEGDILYYFDSTFTFNATADDYIGLDIKENDYINSKVLYRLDDSNKLTILYKNQTGFKEKTPNVVEKNFNNDKELLVPIENTSLKVLNGNYDIEELMNMLSETEVKQNTRKN